MRALSILALFVITASASRAHAVTYEINPTDDLWARLSSLAPGDEVIVHAGTYPQSSRFEATWAGTAAMPIVVRGATGEARPVLMRDGGQNLMNLHGSYFTLRGFEMTGGSHGIRMSRVDHAVLEDLEVHGTGDVAISCNIADAGGTPNGCSFVTIRGCELHTTSGTGEGLYLGCNDGACSFSDSIIERNYIHDTAGSQGDGIEIKSGSWGNVIRDNVIFDTNYPGIFVYTYTPAAGRTPNVIERNLIVRAGDHGIQITGRAIIRNNIVIGSGASGIASQVNQGTPTEIVIVHNTVVGATDSCFRASAWDTGTGFVVANNALYCDGVRAIRFASSHSAMVAGNVVRGTVEGTATGFTMGAGLTADLGTESAMGRVYPPVGSAVLDVAVAAHAVSDDFDLRPRGAMPDVGAYERNASGMPAWLAVPGFKVLETTAPGTDGGVPNGDGGTTPGVDGGTTPGVDGGTTPGVDGGTTPGVDGGARDGGGGPGSMSGACGCRVPGRGGAGRGGEGRGALFVLALVALVAIRRRR